MTKCSVCACSKLGSCPASPRGRAPRCTPRASSSPRHHSPVSINQSTIHPSNHNHKPSRVEDESPTRHNSQLPTLDPAVFPPETVTPNKPNPWQTNNKHKTSTPRPTRQTWGRIQPIQTRHHTMVSQVVEQERHLVGTVVPAATGAAHVAYALADVVDLQPFSDKHYEAPVGAIAEQWASLGRTNCAGNVPHVNVVESVSLCSGANLADVYTKAGKRPAVLSGSRALLNMVPHLFPLTTAKIPGMYVC
jgi:hypothetical protein